MGMTEIMEMVLNIGLQPALLILFAGYFFKRDKDREESLVEESTGTGRRQRPRRMRSAGSLRVPGPSSGTRKPC